MIDDSTIKQYCAGIGKTVVQYYFTKGKGKKLGKINPFHSEKDLSTG